MTEHKLKEDSVRVMERASALKLDRHVLNFFFFFYYLLFIWLCQLLVVAHGIFSLLRCSGSLVVAVGLFRCGI